MATQAVKVKNGELQGGGIGGQRATSAGKYLERFRTRASFCTTFA